MSDNEKTELDSWDKALEIKLQELKSCQTNHNVNDCFDCDKLLACDFRREYVKAVYESMSKGSMGGFEF
ncbi:MAG: hypothetical protein M0P43_07910 [Arcobacteraceae bacterium]|jgi:hypothetical protein|nr:hypothetical protein [Arcobacteraceae bacterium]MDY0328778.1 hypothetical protein [Arcobacteraceae bacterium]